VPPGGRDELIAGFRSRLGRVEHWPGFQRIEVWADASDPTAFVMVCWWDTEEAFRTYMGSPDHRASHKRIPVGELRPRPDRFTRYTLVAR
jgi:heme-degrading monooxygenase HmoA